MAHPTVPTKLAKRGVIRQVLLETFLSTFRGSVEEDGLEHYPLDSGPLFTWLTTVKPTPMDDPAPGAPDRATSSTGRLRRPRPGGEWSRTGDGEPWGNAPPPERERAASEEAASVSSSGPVFSRRALLLELRTLDSYIASRQRRRRAA